jgi:hypothetical protein
LIDGKDLRARHAAACGALKTVTLAVPALVMSAAVIFAVNCVG